MHWSPAHRPVFPSAMHQRLFFDLLGEIQHNFSIDVHAYCLLEDGYELLVHTPKANLSRAMRHLNGVYTQAYNRLQETDGPLFRGRFKSVVVDHATYLSRLTRYIHWRPMEAAQLDDAEASTLSSYPAYIGTVSPPAWLQMEPTLSLFGNDRRRRYQAFCTEGVDDELRRFYADGRVCHILGSQAFRERIGELLHCDGIDQDPDCTDDARPDMAAIAEATARFFAVEVECLYHGQRGKRNLPRAVAMALCHRPGGYTLEQVAHAFGVHSLAAVSLAVYRLKAKLREAPELSQELELLRRQLF